MNARQLAEASLTAVRNRDREGWLALFDEDATIEDPVGASALNPDGRGRQGRAAITRFHDDVIATMRSFDFTIERCYLCGDEAAVVVTFRITGDDDGTLEMDLVNIYRASPGGKLASLRSFWDGSRQGRQDHPM